jgi:hypothetical protein
VQVSDDWRIIKGIPASETGISDHPPDLINIAADELSLSTDPD